MEQKDNIYKLAAATGIPMGVLMSAISLCTIFSDRVNLLAMVAIILLVCGPLMLYHYQRRFFIAVDGKTTYSTLWLYGILSIVCSALISGLVTLLTIQYVRPSWFYDMVQNTVESMNQMPAYYADSVKPMVNELRHMVDAGLLPSPVEFVVQMFWNVCLSGVIMSAITSAFAARIIRH